MMPCVSRIEIKSAIFLQSLQKRVEIADKKTRNFPS